MTSSISFAFTRLYTAQSSLLAHAGHGKDGGSNSLLHYVIEPDHAWTAIALLGLLAAIAALTVRALRKSRRSESL